MLHLAEVFQHFAVLSHGIHQILLEIGLHVKYLHKIVVCGLTANAVQHLAVIGHGLNQVLHNLHSNHTS